jgi:protein subunit release factor B
MKLPPQSRLSDAKYCEIRGRLERLSVDLNAIEESFIHGGGSGGQKINKTENTVQLKHLPSGMVIRCGRFRERAMNRLIALRELLDRLDPKAPRGEKAGKIRRQKARRTRRAAKKREG